MGGHRAIAMERIEYKQAHNTMLADKGGGEIKNRAERSQELGERPNQATTGRPEHDLKSSRRGRKSGISKRATRGNTRSEKVRVRERARSARMKRKNDTNGRHATRRGETHGGREEKEWNNESLNRNNDNPRRQADGRDRGAGKILRTRNTDARIHAQRNKAPPSNTSTHRNSRARPHAEEQSNCQSQINRKAKKSARVRTKAQRQGKSRGRGGGAGQNKTKTETADPSCPP